MAAARPVRRVPLLLLQARAMSMSASTPRRVPAPFRAVQIPPLEQQMGARVEHVVIKQEGLLSDLLSMELRLSPTLFIELMRFGAGDFGVKCGAWRTDDGNCNMPPLLQWATWPYGGSTACSLWYACCLLVRAMPHAYHAPHVSCTTCSLL